MFSKISNSLNKLKNLIHVRKRMWSIQLTIWEKDFKDTLPYFHSFLTGRMLDSALKQMMLCAKLVEIAPVASIKKIKMPKQK